MHLLPLSTALLSLASTISAIPTTNHVLHEKRSDGPHSAWKKHSRAVGSEILPVRIGLKQRNLKHAERFIHDISDPSSPNFGKHWSSEKVANVFAPAKETGDAVVEWLVNAGIDMKRIKFSTGEMRSKYGGTIRRADETVCIRQELGRV